MNRILFGLVTLTTITQAAETAPRDVSTLLEPLLAKYHLPGIAAVVIRGDTIVAEGVAGVRKAGAPEKISPDDQFHLGSDTKAMTATLIAMLVDEGKLTWNTTVAEGFAGKIPVCDPAWKNVTLHQLLAHRAGLPRSAGSPPRGDSPRAQRLALAAATLAQPPPLAPGGKYVYSNLGYTLLGAWLEVATDRSWEDLMRERLFKPLGMVSAGFGPAGTPGKVDQPWGHTAQGQPVDPGSPNADNPPMIGPAGTAHMSLRDWAKFASLHLRGDPANPHATAKLLRPETFAALHKPAENEDYMGGWRITGPRRILGHEGDNLKSHCLALVSPATDLAVLVACNRGGATTELSQACSEVASALIREISTAEKSATTRKP